MNINYNIILDIFLESLIPSTKIAIKEGNKIFGAVILKKSDLSILVTGTNNELKNPLFHGEISAINNFCARFVSPISYSPHPGKNNDFIFNFCS